jgi:hypothetical protein
VSYLLVSRFVKAAYRHQQQSNSSSCWQQVSHALARTSHQTAQWHMCHRHRQIYGGIALESRTRYELACSGHKCAQDPSVIRSSSPTPTNTRLKQTITAAAASAPCCASPVRWPSCRGNWSAPATIQKFQLVQQRRQVLQRFPTCHLHRSNSRGGQVNCVSSQQACVFPYAGSMQPYIIAVC